jgi:hypothetical protein
MPPANQHRIIGTLRHHTPYRTGAGSARAEFNISARRFQNHECLIFELKIQHPFLARLASRLENFERNIAEI